MVKSMKTKIGSSTRQFKFEAKSIQRFKTLELEDFFTRNTFSFFEITGLNTIFLNEDPEIWENLEEFKSAKKMLDSIAVTNDCAERGVALIQNYTQKLQYLLQVVDDHRKKFPNSNKNTLQN